MNNLSVLHNDINEYKKQANYIFLKANRRLSEELKKETLSTDQIKIIKADKRRILSIAKQLEDLEILN